jgi:hypothetical protein
MEIPRFQILSIPKIRRSRGKETIMDKEKSRVVGRKKG